MTLYSQLFSLTRCWICTHPLAKCPALHRGGSPPFSWTRPQGSSPSSGCSIRTTASALSIHLISLGGESYTADTYSVRTALIKKGETLCSAYSSDKHVVCEKTLRARVEKGTEGWAESQGQGPRERGLWYKQRVCRSSNFNSKFPRRINPGSKQGRRMSC